MATAINDLELDALKAALSSPKQARLATDKLDGYRFSDKAGQWAWRAIRDIYGDTGKVPSVKLLVFKAQNDIKSDDLFDDVTALLRQVVKRANPQDLPAILPELTKAYNTQQILSTVDQLIDAAQNGDMDAAHDAMESGGKTLSRRTDRTGSAGLAELARRALVEQDLGDFVPTGLAWMDRRIRGIAKSEVFLMAGITGIGKSVSMIQAGQAAIGAGRRVLHVTTEMSREQVTYRYLSRFTGIPEQNIRERRMSQHERALLNAWLDRNETRMNDLLRIEQVMPNSGTVADIQAAVNELDRDGTPPDLIIIDSPDHLRSLRKYNNWMHESTEVWWSVKALADQGFAIWATTQIARGKWEHKLATPEAVADNYNKARIATAFFSINWGLDKKGKHDGTRRLYWGKYRSGEARKVVPLRCDIKRMIMVTEPEPEPAVTTRVD